MRVLSSFGFSECVCIIFKSPSLFIFALFSVVGEFFYDFSFPAHLMILFVLFVLHFHHSSDSRRATVSLLVCLLFFFFCSVFGRTNPGEQIWNQNVFVFLNCVCVATNAALVSPLTSLSFLCFCLSRPFLCSTEDDQEGERRHFSDPLLVFSQSVLIFQIQHISQCSLLFYFFFLVSRIALLDHFPIFFSSSTDLVSFDMLTSFSTSTVLSGVFQTHGACQEAPGLARLSPCFTPTRSDARLQSCASS